MKKSFVILYAKTKKRMQNIILINDNDENPLTNLLFII
jgi:hypothetical protein